MKTVKVILCTFNDFRYLREQLDSIINQKNVLTSIEIYDDSDHENKKELKTIVESYKENRIYIKKGNYSGYADNFFISIRETAADYDYYAFSDQDDIWHLEKLTNAINKLSSINSEPGLYCSKTIIVNSENKKIGYSPTFIKEKSFKNALVQSIAGGNTMVMNKELKLFIEKLTFKKGLIISHDWSIYQIVTGAGFKLIYDKEPQVRYRQHEDNIIGSNNGILEKFKRFLFMLRGDFKDWNNRNFKFLSMNYNFLTEENKKIITNIEKKIKRNNIKNIFVVYKMGLYRQTLLGNLGMYIAVLIGKFK